MTQDGLYTEYQNFQNTSGTNLSYATASGLLAFPTAYAGSPAVGNLTIQAGSAIVTNVPVAVVFGIPFASAPAVIVGPAASGVAGMIAYVSGATSAGSFMLFGLSGLAAHWMAIGSGRV